MDQMMDYRKCHFKGGWVTIKQLLEQNVRSSDIIWCLSGGTRVYAKTQKGEGPMLIKDLVRLDP